MNSLATFSIIMVLIIRLWWFFGSFINRKCISGNLMLCWFEIWNLEWGNLLSVSFIVVVTSMADLCVLNQPRYIIPRTMLSFILYIVLFRHVILLMDLIPLLFFLIFYTEFFNGDWATRFFDDLLPNFWRDLSEFSRNFKELVNKMKNYYTIGTENLEKSLKEEKVRKRSVEVNNRKLLQRSITPDKSKEKWKQKHYSRMNSFLDRVDETPNFFNPKTTYKSKKRDRSVEEEAVQRQTTMTQIVSAQKKNTFSQPQSKHKQTSSKMKGDSVMEIVRISQTMVDSNMNPND